MSIIEDLYFGEYQPAVQELDKDIKTFEVYKYVERNIETLKEMLSDEQKKVFNKFLDNINELVTCVEYYNFEKGVKFGGKLVIEIEK